MVYMRNTRRRLWKPYRPFFRSEGVVDFIDVKFFGIFGMERWPTFNAADSFIVCCGIGLGVNLILQGIKQKKLKDS